MDTKRNLRYEIVCHTFENMQKIVAYLLTENYIVCVSREDELYIVNYEWSPFGNRNDIVFMTRDNYEDELDELEKGWEEWHNKE